MKIERELMRGAGPVAVLKLLERHRMYGYELVEALAKRSDGALAMGQSTLYPMLYNLEAKGWITAEWEAADSGRKRKYYSLTDSGRKQLARKQDDWQRLLDAFAAMGIATKPTPGA